MQAIPRFFLGAASLAAAALSALSGAPAAGTDTDAFPVFDNYLLLSGQGVRVSGDSAAFQARNWTSRSGYGGIEDYRYSKDLSNDFTLQLDGHALGITSDYLAHLNLAKSEVGSVDAGYERFRTFYDGVGGFFPLNNQWFALSYSNLHVDRSKFWVETTIALPHKPVITLKYTNELRDGMKDSTIWADTDFTGLPTGQTISQVRKIAPAYRQLGERHQTLEGTIKQTVGNTTIELRLLGDKVNNDDTLFATRYPGEIKAPSGANPNNQVRFYSDEGIAAKTLSAEARTETILNPSLTFRTGLSYQFLNSDFTGNRPLYTSTPTAAGPVVVNTYNFLDLLGGSRAKIYTGNVGLDWKPSKDFLIQVALRGEDRYTTSAGSFSTVGLASGSTTVTGAPVLNSIYSRVKDKVATPTADLRYTGINNLVLYASATKRMLAGDERYATPYATATPAPGSLTFNDVAEDHGNYTLGANWRASSLLTLRAEVFNKDHKNRFDGYDVTTGTQYVLGYDFTGVKLTATLKPLPTLSLTSRYVGQKGTMQVTSGTYSAYDSMDARNHTFGESLDWTPTRQFYFQGNVNVVFDDISTVYPRAGVAANGLNADAILQNAKNNYWNASALAGFVVDAATDAQVQYTFYRADNFQPELAATTTPYGAGITEHTITVGLKHKFSNRLVGSARVGYFSSKNDTTGGFTNYNGVLAYLSLDYKL